MDASSGKSAIICGVIACTTGVGAVIGIPLIILGMLVMTFGKKPQ